MRLPNIWYFNRQTEGLSSSEVVNQSGRATGGMDIKGATSAPWTGAVCGGNGKARSRLTHLVEKLLHLDANDEVNDA